MTKARILANFISDGNTFADEAITVTEVTGAAPIANPSFTGTVTSSGSVGIGTSSPSSTLHLKPTVDSINGGLRLESEDGSQYATIDMNNAGNLRFYQNGTSRMRISSDGSVGIGTSSITRELELWNSDSTTYGSTTRADAGTNQRIFNTSNTNSVYAGLTLAANNGGSTTSEFTIANVSTSSNYLGELVFQAKTGVSSYAERMRITSSGSVGIGTSSPLLPLTIVGGDGDPASSGSTATGALQIQQGTNDVVLEAGVKSNSDRYAWLQSTNKTNHTSYNMALNPNGGNVGIGTSSPLSKLHIENTSSNDGIRIINSTSGEGFVIFGDTADNNTGSIAYNHSSDAMTFDVNNSERMRLDDSGNLGIGTTAPTSYAKNTGIAIRGGNQAGVETYAGQDASDTTAFLNMYADQNNNYQRYFDVGAVGASSGQGSNMRFLTQPSGGTPRVHMQIDQSGRVTMPYQPAFCVNASASVLTFSGTERQLAGTWSTSGSFFNRAGSGFNASNSRFTAPVSGVYHHTISFTAWYAGNQNPADGWQIRAKVNGSNLEDFFHAGGGATGYEDRINANILLDLSQNDYVEFYVTGYAHTFEVQQLVWGGHLIG